MADAVVTRVVGRIAHVVMQRSVVVVVIAVPIVVTASIMMTRAVIVQAAMKTRSSGHLAQRDVRPEMIAASADRQRDGR